MRQVFAPPSSIDREKQSIVLSGNAFHHLVHVLRKAKGEELDVFDGRGAVYRARIAEIGRETVALHIVHARDTQQAGGMALTLAVAMLKGKKMQWLMQKATEIGVHTIVPLVTRRTVVKAEEGSQAKLLQWEKIAVQASQQCGRAFVPNIHHPIRWQDFLKQSRDFDAKLMAWEGKTALPFKRWARAAMPAWSALNRPAGVVLAIGPEGGFTDEETAEAKEAGFETVGFGADILRSETAAIVAGAIVLYEALPA